jgi:eukaryotic-like serine/threonine-protein kinase
MACVNEQTVQELVSGRLAGDALEDAEQHLADCSACAQLVALAGGSGLVSGGVLRRAPPRTRSERSLSPGTLIGHYVVHGFLGAGGMGEVYAAYDPSLERKLAIKFLRPEMVGRGDHAVATERLRREARVVAKLSHPNVVTVYEIGVYGDRVFIAMEHIDGDSVSEWLRRSPRTPAEIVRVFLAAGAGLSAAHAAGVIHRDFKPHNVMLTKGGDVRVMDFGLAQFDTDEDAHPHANVPAPEGQGDDRLTRTGTLLGTPAYMAPEQLRGGRANTRTDQYSFCVALYEALHGRRPPGPARPATRATSSPDTPDAASTRPVPSWIRRILKRGLAADPAQRYPSMDDLLAELRADTSKRRRVITVLVAAGVVVAASWAGFHSQRARRALYCSSHDARAAEVWPLNGANPDRARSGPAGAVWAAFARSGVADAPAVFARVSRTLSKYLEQWSARAGDTCEATHVRGEQSKEVLALRTACLDERLDAARALTGSMVRADAKVVAHAADAALSLPDLDRCSELALLRAAVKPPEGAAARAEVERLRRRMGELKLLASTGQFESVAADIKALERDIRRADHAPLLVDFLLLVHSNLWANAGVPIAQPGIVREALAIAQASGYEEGAAEALVGLVAVEYRNAPVSELASAQADALLRHLGDPAVLRGWLENNRSLAAYGQAHLSDAIEHTRRALALKRQRTPPDGRDLAASESNLCMYLQERGQAAQALPSCERAVALASDAVGSGHPQTMNSLENQASVLVDLGRLDEGCAMAERVATHFRGIGERIDGRIPLLLTLGRCALGRQRRQAARDWFQRALAEATTTRASAMELAAVESQLARALLALGERTRAAALMDSAARRYETLPELAFRAREARAWLAAQR